MWDVYECILWCYKGFRYKQRWNGKMKNIFPRTMAHLTTYYYMFNTSIHATWHRGYFRFRTWVGAPP
jgi:hypothetical protein